MKNTNKELKAFYTTVFADEIVLRDIKNGYKKVLDFGCGDGAFTKRLVSMAKQVYGCDLDVEQIEEAKKNSKGVLFKIIKANASNIYPKNTFDCVTLMGVLEHVKDEKELLLSLHKMLKSKGTLYIYILNKGLFSFLDSANLKFIFPGLHKVLYYFFYGKNAYSKEFIDKKKKGMVGDFTDGKKWHTHYSLQDMEKLLNNKFRIEKFWYYSLFLPIILMLDFVYVSFFKRHNNYISNLIRLDNNINFGGLSYSLVIKCSKISTL